LKELTKGLYDLDFGTRQPELRARYGPVRVDAGQEIKDLELVVPGSARISGSVRFEDGTGAPGVMVTAARQGDDGKPRYPMHWEGIQPNQWDDDREPSMDFNILIHDTRTDEAGDFVLEDLQGGTYTVNARFTATDTARKKGRGGLEKVVTIEDGTEAEVDLEMVDPYTMEKRLTVRRLIGGESEDPNLRLNFETVPIETVSPEESERMMEEVIRELGSGAE
jgi:hypothetical protein